MTSQPSHLSVQGFTLFDMPDVLGLDNDMSRRPARGEVGTPTSDVLLKNLKKSQHRSRMCWDLSKMEGTWMRKIQALLLSLMLFTGCAYASKMNRVSLGMTKQEVLKVMGDPVSQKARGDTEILEYRFYTEAFRYDIDSYWVTLRNGKVVEYGRAGDFGSATPATIRIEHDDLDK